MRNLLLNKSLRRIVLLMTALCMVMLSACGSKAAPKPEEAGAGTGPEQEMFRIAVIPVQTEGNLGEAMERLQTILADALGREVAIQDYPDYNGVVEAMNFGHVDMAFFGPLTYVIAHHKSGAEAIVVQLVKGEPHYYSYIITHKDSPWTSLDELLADPGSVSFAFGDPNSTSGSLVPGRELKQRGVLADEQQSKFREVRYTGSHDITALAVQNKDVDAGAIDSAIYENLIANGTIDESQFRVIWKSDALYQYPWAVKKGTNSETIALLQETFESITDEVVLQGFGISGFAKTSNADYESIRAVAESEGRLE